MEKVKKIKIGCKPYEVYDPSAHERIDQLEQRDLLENITVEAHVDDTTGTPNVNVVKGENKITLNFSGLKGQPGIDGLDAVGEQGPEGPQGETGPEGPQGPQGEPGYDGKTGKTPHITANATYDASIAGNSPHVHVDVDGTDENPVFNFRFSGLRGKDGVDGQDGQDGKDGVDGMNAKAEDIERAVHTEIESQLDALDADLQTLSWLKYAIDGHEDDKQAFARLIAAARDYKDSGKTKLDEAYAGVNALVTKQADGTFIATSFLTSLVGSNTQGGSQEGYSGIITSADIHEAMVNVFANYTNDANTMTARIFALANAEGSNILLDADRINLNASDINAITKDTTVLTQGLQIKAGDQEYNSSRTISVNGSSDGTLNISARKVAIDSNSDEGWAYINSEHVHIGDNASNSDITIGSTSSDGDISIGSGSGTIAIQSTQNTVNIKGSDIVLNDKTVVGLSGISIYTSENKSGSYTSVGDGAVSFSRTSTYGTIEGSVGAGGISLPGISYTVYNPSGLGSTFAVSNTVQAKELTLTDGTETVTLDVNTLKQLIQRLS